MKLDQDPRAVRLVNLLNFLYSSGDTPCRSGLPHSTTPELKLPFAQDRVK